MNASDFDFDLPDELIAQEPPGDRGASRLLVLDRRSGRMNDTVFARLVDYLAPGDLLVLNDTRVFPARLLGVRVPSGGAVECLLVRQLPTPNVPTPSETQGSLGSCDLGVGSSSWWEALVHPGQKLKPGAQVSFTGGGLQLHGEILHRHFQGRRTVRLWTGDGSDVATAIDRLGHIPLPPYIKREDRVADRERYQTVYARARGSIAAPTAGLHFTRELLGELHARGIERTAITLHVGYGTFKPVRVDAVEQHIMDAEAFTVPADAAAALTRARSEGRRVIAVGTTTTRALESVAIDTDGRISASTGETQLFIRPGHEFRVVRGLITNFHLPRSSLLVLVAAFAGREQVLAAYRHAVEERYRFYSYGDAMLIL
jgi:S-adenosylmethionine:tRNA ribosyltransferase-isomerase